MATFITDPDGYRFEVIRLAHPRVGQIKKSDRIDLGFFVLIFDDSAFKADKIWVRISSTPFDYLARIVFDFLRQKYWA